MSNTSSFILVSTSGARYSAVEISSRINTDNHEESNSMAGLSEFRLTDGRSINMVDDNTFVIVSTGEELRREP